MIKLYTPALEDKRISYAVFYLKKLGYDFVNKVENCDYVLMPPKMLKSTQLKNAINYLNDESFAIENAYLTAEGAISIAISNSDFSLSNSKILIAGYGRIGKALHHYLKPFTNNITVCARREEQLTYAQMNGAYTIKLDGLKAKNNFDFIFNTIDFPVFNKDELSAIKNDALIIDLASFPGGIDKHLAELKGVSFIEAQALPGKYSAKNAGMVLAKAVDRIVREGRL